MILIQLLLIVFFITCISTQNAGDTLYGSQGQFLSLGSYLQSKNRCFRLTLQEDGNLVMTTANNHEQIWSTSTKGTGVVKAVMQTNGEFVLYDVEKSVKWSSRTRHAFDGNLVMQDDGNLAIHTPQKRYIWHTGTSGQTIFGDSCRDETLIGEKNQFLISGNYLLSNNSCFKLTLQEDGNLVLQSQRDEAKMWSTKTSGATKAVLQSDGNFVLYDKSNKTKWSTGTGSNPRSSLVLQNDGNLVLKSEGDNLVWATNTTSSECSDDALNAEKNQFLKHAMFLQSNNSCFRLIMQDDGNLVLYNVKVQFPMWASRTDKSPSAKAVMQSDGNLVLYDSENNPTWSTRTTSKSPSHLIVQNDGNLVIYEKSGNPLWATHTFASC